VSLDETESIGMEKYSDFGDRGRLFAAIFGCIPVFEGTTIARRLKNRSAQEQRKTAVNFGAVSIDNELGNWAIGP
jgi:hypothetical protein